MNCLGEFQQIYNSGTLGTYTNLLDFEVKRSKVKVMKRPDTVKNESQVVSGL